ncbi:recombinase family protein [Vibrio sp. 10N.247.311.18]|uniref:recombinase family protein n=1 Tax=unclassified Vibrio TaxID=2614977 RepID=UPI00354D5D2D
MIESNNADTRCLRAPTNSQDTARAKESMTDFLKNMKHSVSGWFIENKLGVSLHSHELMRLLGEANKGCVLFIEQVVRLTRLTAEDWKRLRRIIEDKQVHIVSMDLPTKNILVLPLSEITQVVFVSVIIASMSLPLNELPHFWPSNL